MHLTYFVLPHVPLNNDNFRVVAQGLSDAGDNVEKRYLQNRGAEGETDLDSRCAWASQMLGPCLGAAPCTDPGTQHEWSWGEYGNIEDD